MKQKVARRRDKRIWYLLGGVFAAVFSFSFLAQRFKSDDEAQAANLAAFDPGYIISDYQMSNYNAMNEAEIQNFLKSKNSCNDRDLGKYTVGEKVGYLSEMMPPRTWHVSEGRFVCMADEVFGGGTAAHIIYRAAQDYRINPQVLIVLLEKEQSLVSDTFPHSGQYRSATGYGCPDTAECSSKYYGFQNQIRNAAALFRTVLDGGWTNYPLGENYVQYNPNASCGGSVVNIRNLATSALYRYTPYQPNAATLGGWSDGCNAYGNLNFYRLFEDWFGGITRGGVVYKQLDTPRFMTSKNDGNFVNPLTGKEVEEKFYTNEPQMFVTKAFYNGEWCLRTREDTEIDAHRCIPMSRLDNLSVSYIALSDQEQYKIIKSGASKLSPVDKKIEFVKFKTNSFRRFTKYFVYGGKKYYVTESDDSSYAMPLYGFTEDELIPLDGYEKTFKYLETTCEPKSKIDFADGSVVRLAANGRIARLFTASVIYNGQKYYITDNDNRYEMLPLGISEECLGGANRYVSFDTPREMVVKNDTYSYDPGTNSIYGFIKKGKIIYFDEKIEANGKWYFRSRYNSEKKLDIAIPAVDLGNI